MKTKKLLCALLALVMVFALLPVFSVPANAAGDVAINSTNFPDDNFRSYVSSNFDTDGNSVLSTSEIAAATNISVGGKNITSLKGVEHFTALKELDCHNNQLTALDLSKNTALEKLWCYNNQLTALNLSKNTALIILHCEDNTLTELNISGCTALEELTCDNNQLTELDVSKNTALGYFECFNNALTELDVSKNTALHFLCCSNNQLTTLDVSKNTALNILSCQNNALTELNVSSCTALMGLECYGNHIAQLDISGCPKLVDVYVNGTKTECTRGGVTFWEYVKDQDGLNVDFATTVITEPISKPAITTQPKNVTVDAGKTATFKVVATGTGLSYQWYYRTSSSGEWTAVKTNGKAATYTLTTAARHNGYQYRCKVTNAAGSVYSRVATLTVVTKPTITTQPKNVSVSAGKTATFKVVASGTGLSYQWYYQKPKTTTWVKVSSNGTSATYKLTTAARHNGYKYRCVVTNSAGSVTSNEVTLTVK